jgi:hypothetical protein
VTTGTHGGSKAQGWTPDGWQAILAQKTPLAKQWYKMSAWLKRTAGSASNIRAELYQAMHSYSRALSSATYVQLGGVVYTDDTVNLTALFATPATAAFDSVVLDDISLKQLTKTSLYKLVSGSAGYTVKGRFTWDPNNIVGVISHSDGTLDNCLIAYYTIGSDNVYSKVALDQIVAGVRASLVLTYTNTPGAGGGGTPTSTQWLEIRYTDTNKVTLYHNDVAVGTEQDIAEFLQANTHYGIIDTGGSTTNLFFAGELQAVNIGAAGSSNTFSATGYFYDLSNQEKPQYLVTRKNAAANGQGITSYTLPNYANLEGSVQVVGDTTGDNKNPDHLYGVEAFIRKCHADGYKLLILAMPVWTDDDLNNGQVNTPANKTVLELIISLLDHYGITYVNMWALTQAHVTGGGNLSDYWADKFHPSEAGQLVAAAALAPYYVTGGAIPSPLAARVYPESEALE